MGKLTKAISHEVMASTSKQSLSWFRDADSNMKHMIVLLSLKKNVSNGVSIVTNRHPSCMWHRRSRNTVQIFTVAFGHSANSRHVRCAHNFFLFPIGNNAYFNLK